LPAMVPTGRGQSRLALSMRVYDVRAQMCARRCARADARAQMCARRCARADVRAHLRAQTFALMQCARARILSNRLRGGRGRRQVIVGSGRDSIIDGPCEGSVGTIAERFTLVSI
jgi:hypothetical protein